MDFGVIGEVIGLAGGAANATGKAAETLKTISGMLKSDKKPDTDEAAKLLNVLAVELTAANLMNVGVSTALKELSQELHRQDEFEKQKARYELVMTNQNVPVYKLMTGKSDGQPMHYICPVCLNRDKLVSFIAGEGDYKVCQTDNNHLFEFANNPY
ncbi:hypothetical protein [Sulfitobacter sp.]|uniref:hypothetical protein n=1 Tax=Sulfitobacter sp. TaxID=1903071 RepID=UPI00300208EE